MARTVAGNEIILAMNRMITPAFITSVTVDLHMPAMSCSFIFFNFMSG